MQITQDRRSGLRQMFVVIALALGAGWGALASCGGAGECTPGESASCACPDGSQGAQVCRDDGTFAPCSCSQGTGGGSSSSGSSGSTASSGGAASSGSGVPIHPCWRCCCQIGNQTSCDVTGNNSAPSCPITCTGMCSDESTQKCLPFDCNAP